MKSKVGEGTRRFRLVLTAVACCSGLIQGIDFERYFHGTSIRVKQTIIDFSHLKVLKQKFSEASTSMGCIIATLLLHC